MEGCGWRLFGLRDGVLTGVFVLVHWAREIVVENRRFVMYQREISSQVPDCAATSPATVCQASTYSGIGNSCVARLQSCSIFLLPCCLHFTLFVLSHDHILNATKGSWRASTFPYGPRGPFPRPSARNMMEKRPRQSKSRAQQRVSLAWVQRSGLATDASD